MLTFTEISDICSKRGLLLKALCSELDITDAGFRYSINNETLPAKKIPPLCSFLGISVSEFFGLPEQSGDNVSGYQQKQGKKQVMNFGAKELQQTIEILKDQLKKKDDQIDKLLTRL